MATADGEAAGAPAGGDARIGEKKPLIGQFGLIGISMSGVIGSGWLLGGQDAANLAGKWAWASWAVGAVALGCMGLVMVALATRLPQNGALVRWPYESSGKTVATIIGAGLVVTYAANLPTEAAAVVRGLCPKAHSLCHLTKDSPVPSLTWHGLGIAAGVMTLVLLINWLGLRVVSNINGVFAVAKFVIPVVTAIALFHYHFRWNPPVAPGGHAPHVGVGDVLRAVTLAGVVFGFTGFQGPIDHAGETDNPRHLRRAVLIGLAAPAVIYIALQVAYSGHTDVRDTLFNTPYLQMADSISAAWLFKLLLIDGVASPFATTLVFASFIGAELRTAAQDGLVPPRAIARVSGKHDVPRIALLVNYGLGLLMLLLLHDWERIVSATGIIAMFVYSYTAVSYSAFRRTWVPPADEPRARNPFTASYRVLAPLSFTVATVLAYAPGLRTLTTALAFMAGVALLVFVLSSFVVEAHPRLHRIRSLWLIGYFLALYGMRLLGSWTPLPAPVAITLTAALGLGFYYLGVAQSVRFRRERRA